MVTVDKYSAANQQVKNRKRRKRKKEREREREREREKERERECIQKKETFKSQCSLRIYLFIYLFIFFFSFIYLAFLIYLIFSSYSRCYTPPIPPSDCSTSHTTAHHFHKIFFNPHLTRPTQETVSGFQSLEGLVHLL